MLEEVGQEDVSLGTKLNSGPFLDHPSYLQRSEEQPPPPTATMFYPSTCSRVVMD